MPRYNTSLPNKTITGTTTIVTPDSGSFVQLVGTAPYTVTLPAPSAFPGQTLTFHNTTSGTVTLSTPSGAFTGLGASGTATQQVLPNTVASVISDSVNYVTLSEDGSVLFATDATVTGNLTVNTPGTTTTISPANLTINPGNSGSVNNVNIGASTRGSGAFTSLTANSAVTLTANTTSSGTSSGTLVVTGGVGVSGTVHAGAFNGPLTGTLQTAAQPNITSVGTLSGLTVTNTITGSVSGSAATATTAGTVTTAAQPNITSVGTLSSLSVTGNVGIGIDTPAGKLHLFQSSGGSNSLTLATNFANGNNFAINPFITGVSNGGFSIRDITNSVERIVIQYNTGNVGIGTTNPVNPLHVVDTRNYVHSTTADSSTNMSGIRVTNSNNNDNWSGVWFATGGTQGSHWAGIAGARTNSASTWGTHLSFFTHEDSTVNLTQATERLRITSAGNVNITTGSLTIGDVIAGRTQVDIMKLWRSADIQGYKASASDGGGINYTWDNGLVRVDTSIGSHNWDIGKIRLPAGSYMLAMQYRPSPTQHGWNVYGSNSNAHIIRLISDNNYGAFNTFLTVSGQLNKDVGYSQLFMSGTYVVSSEGTYRIQMQTDPYSSGGYKYFVEAAYLIKIR